MKTKYDVGQSVFVKAKIVKIVNDDSGLYYYIGLTDTDNSTIKLWFKEKNIFALESQKEEESECMMTKSKN